MGLHLVVKQLCIEGFITSPTRKRGLHFRQRFALACASGSLLNSPAISSCPTTRISASITVGSIVVLSSPVRRNSAGQQRSQSDGNSFAEPDTEGGNPSDSGRLIPITNSSHQANGIHFLMSPNIDGFHSTDPCAVTLSLRPVVFALYMNSVTQLTIRDWSASLRS